MLGLPKPKEYTAVEDEEAADFSETESNENLLHDQKKRRVRHHKSNWIPQVRCNTAGTVLLAALTAATVLVTIQCTICTAVRHDDHPVRHQVRRPLHRPQRLRPFPHLPPRPKPRSRRGLDPHRDRGRRVPHLRRRRDAPGQRPHVRRRRPALLGLPPDKQKLMGLEAFHLLHCLNAVRKGLVTTYDYYWGSRGYGFAPPAVFARHLDHCVDVLRQHLMCHADLEPFVFNWREGQEKPYADFAVRKTCVDFDYMLEWAERRKDPRHNELWKNIKKPEGALEREAPEGLPQITNDTVWSKNGLFPVANLTGLGGKEYCLSPAS
ncbi:hypothetical protein PG985_012634 [Apiospora marii]|uniref:uncharacterized protein n=1 Tax=Apiospora marii TaxID=335849 RepID=UPI00312DCC2F